MPDADSSPLGERSGKKPHDGALEVRRTDPMVAVVSRPTAVLVVERLRANNLPVRSFDVFDQKLLFMVAAQAVFFFQRRPLGALGELRQLAEPRQPGQCPIQYPRQLDGDNLVGKVRILPLRTADTLAERDDPQSVPAPRLRSEKCGIALVANNILTVAGAL